MSVIIRLPFPDPAMFPNRKNGRHWTAIRAIKSQQHNEAFWFTRGAAQGWEPPDGYIPLSLLFVTPDGRHRDLDNMVAASKALLDGVATALGIDDKLFKPVLSDWVRGDKPGALIVSVGVKITSGVDL